MKVFKHFLVFLAVLAALSGCKDKEVVYPNPVLSVSGDATGEFKPGASLSVTLNINAGGGAKSIIVKRAGGFLEEVPVNADATTFTYSTQKVPETLAEGEEVAYGFALVNKNDVQSAEVAYTVKAALYDKVTVGSESLYNVTIPTDGIVNSGTTIKLIKGRKYQVSSSLTFAKGAKLQVEEGVTVYMLAGQSNPVAIEVQGEADIRGTSTAPVVFTSTRVLTSATPAAPGDWTWLRLTGSGNESNNGVVKYLRIEYGGDRAFRLTDVGQATEIDYVQVYKASGEGVMVTNGNARLKHIVATDCQGGSYRLGDSYSGLMQFIISVNSDQYAENDDFAIREDASPVIANVTLLGPGQDEANTHGMRMRANAKPKVYNAVIAEFPRRGLRGGDNVTITNMAGTAVFAHSFIFNVKSDPYRDLAVAFAGTFDPVSGERLTNLFNNNVIALKGSAFTVETLAGIGVGNFVPSAEKASTFNPSSLNAFFSSAGYVGAVNNAAGDWTKGWVKNPNGAVRN